MKLKNNEYLTQMGTRSFFKKEKLETSDFLNYYALYKEKAQMLS